MMRFFNRFHIDPTGHDKEILLTQLCFAFSQIPYENLTKIVKHKDVISSQAAKRGPDEVLADFLTYGTGGTCFSLTATFVALGNALGLEAHPILADRHYGVNTHCALVFIRDGRMFLIDPGFLINSPTELPLEHPNCVETQFNTVELLPRKGGTTVELFTIVQNNRRSRLLYKTAPVDEVTFDRAWTDSFTWEMMTYPVLTRCIHGKHHYLQGNILRIRNKTEVVKRVLTKNEQSDFITNILGIDRRVVTEAFKEINDGTMSTSNTR